MYFYEANRNNLGLLSSTICPIHPAAGVALPHAVLDGLFRRRKSHRAEQPSYSSLDFLSQTADPAASGPAAGVPEYLHTNTVPAIPQKIFSLFLHAADKRIPAFGALHSPASLLYPSWRDRL